MSYPTTGNLGPSFSDLSAIAAEVEALRVRGRAILADIRPALIGQRVRRYGHDWQISQVQLWAGGNVTCYGVRVSKKGRVGTRGFDLGLLEHCEFLPLTTGKRENG